MGRNEHFDLERFDAALFDLDGVLTDTARVHAACWKEMFDDFLRRRAAQEGQSFRPFDVEQDYRDYVDGKPRYEGVQSFLAARGVELPYGAPDDPPDRLTVCGLGNRKNALIGEHLAKQGVDVYESSVAFVRRLQEAGIRTAVVSSSKNCRAVLQAAGIEGLFQVRVDGEVAASRQLKGKPQPDTFLEAAAELAVEPGRALVVEDAISGVQAGRRGNFGLVIGVARHGNAEALKQNGADLVVADLGELLQGNDGPQGRAR